MPVPLETFYTTASSLCFTLLGFWWAVVELRHGDWMRDRNRRRMATAVSLHFLLPGIMSLMSLLAGDARFLWRVTFSLAGLLGFISVTLIIVSTKPDPGSLALVRAGQWLMLPLYAIISVVAAFPEIVRTLGIGLQPLELEGIILSLLVLFGVSMAWVFLIEPPAAQEK